MLATAVVLAVITTLNRHAEQRRQEKRISNLRIVIPGCLTEIGIGLHVHGNAYKFANDRRSNLPWPPPVPLDATGHPLHSWRMHICQALPIPLHPWPDVNLLQAWDAPVNLANANEVGEFFTFDSKEQDTKAHVFGITGPDSAFDGAVAPLYVDLPPNVVVAMEIRDSKTECFEAGDYNVADLLAYRGRIGDHIHGLLPDRLHVLFADGEVWALDPGAPIADLQPFLTITGAKSHDRDKLLGPHKVP
jgi:hypothetical protein